MASATDLEMPRFPSTTDRVANLEADGVSSAEGSGEIFSVCGDATAAVVDEISPLIDSAVKAVVQKPSKMNIFSVSYSRSKSKDMAIKETDPDFNRLYQMLLWTWGGSKFSGFLCMACYSMTYCIMEMLLLIFPVTSIPLLETILLRCSIVLIMSFLWLRRIGQPLLGPPHATGLLWSFLGAAVILFPVSHVSGQSETTTIVDSSKSGLSSYSILSGLVSSLAGGMSYCFIRLGARSSDQPVLTVFSFVAFATPATAACSFLFEKTVIPDFGSFAVMVILGLLSFVAEVFLARGLQLERVSKAANVQYIEVVLSYISSIIFLGQVPSFLRLGGCLLIMLSILVTLCLGP